MKKKMTFSFLVGLRVEIHCEVEWKVGFEGEKRGGCV